MIVLDTNVWIWLNSSKDRLSHDALAAIEDASALAISAISTWELALLTQRGRIRLSQPVSAWRKFALDQDPRMREVPVDGPIAIEAVAFRDRGMHGDPADQIVLATAAALGGKLVTSDQAIREFAPDLTIW